MPNFEISEYVRLEVDVPAANGNMVLNPSGEYGSWFWPTPAGGLVTSSGTQLNYEKVAGANAYFTTDFMPLEEGKWVAARYDLDALTAGTGVRARLLTYNIDKVQTGSPMAMTATATTTGTKFVGPIQAAAGTAYCKLVLYYYKSDGTTAPSTGDDFTFSKAMVTWRDTNDFSQVTTNLITDPSFETNTTGWTAPATDGSFARTSGTGQVGSWKLTVTKNNGSAGLGFQSANFAVTPGEDYTASAYMRYGTLNNGYGYVGLRFYNSGGTQVMSTGDAGGALTGSYQRFSKSGTAPLTAVTARVHLSFGGGGTPSETYFVDAVAVTQTSTVIDYFDGSTTSGGGNTYAWTGTANNSTSTKTATGFDFTEPGNWTNLFGDSSYITWERRSLDIGLLSASVETDAPVDLDILNNGQAMRITVQTSFGAWEPQYVGTITDWQISYVPKTRVEIQATDALNRLTSFASKYGVGDCADLAWLLEGAGVPWSIDGSGNQLAAAPTYVSSNDSATLLDQIAMTRDSQNAYAAVNRKGVLEVRHVSPPIDYSYACTFTDAPTATVWDFYYDDSVQIGEASSDVINHIMVKYLRYNSSTLTTEEVVYGPYRDEASIRQYGPRSAEFTVHGITESSVPTFAATTLALTKDAVRKPESVTVPVRTLDDLNMCLIDLNWIVGFKYKAFTGNYMITSIKHEIRPGGWDITFGFSKEDGVAAPTVKPTIKPNYTTQTPYLLRWKTGGSPQNISSGSWTKVAFQSVSAKTVGVSYASGDMTIGRAGRYAINVAVSWDSNATGTRRLWLSAGSESFISTKAAAAVTNDSQEVSRVVRLNTGDVVNAQVIQSSGSTRVISDGASETNITITWIGD